MWPQEANIHHPLWMLPSACGDHPIRATKSVTPQTNREALSPPMSYSTQQFILGQQLQSLAGHQRHPAGSRGVRPVLPGLEAPAAPVRPIPLRHPMVRPTSSTPPVALRPIQRQDQMNPRLVSPLVQPSPVRWHQSTAASVTSPGQSTPLMSLNQTGQLEQSLCSAWTPVLSSASGSYRAQLASVESKQPSKVSPLQKQHLANQITSPVTFDPENTGGSPRAGNEVTERWNLRKNHDEIDARMLVNEVRDPTPGESDQETMFEERTASRFGSTSAEAKWSTISSASSYENSATNALVVGALSRRKMPVKMKGRRRNILSFSSQVTGDPHSTEVRPDPYAGASSSDENRSSGHASMSDGHSSSSPPAESLPRRTQHPHSQLRPVPEHGQLLTRGDPGSILGTQLTSRSPHTAHIDDGSRRNRDDLYLRLGGATGLDGVRAALDRLTLQPTVPRTSRATSRSSTSGSESTEPARRLIRHSSLETVNTVASTTAADEFVWVDSHNRLVELQQLPWNSQDLLRVIQGGGRVRDQAARVGTEAVPRLSLLLQRALVRVARELQRLSRPLGLCTKREVLSALRIVLSPALCECCSSACLRAATMYTAPLKDQLRRAKSVRAGLQLSVGAFHRWMCDVRIGKYVHEYASVYLSASMEAILEELVLLGLPSDPNSTLSTSLLETAVSKSGDFWGLLQPYAHLNAGRTACGALVLPRLSKPATAGAENSQSSCVATTRLSSPSSCISPSSCGQQRGVKNIQQVLLTTCVGSAEELACLVSRLVQSQSWLPAGSLSRRKEFKWSPSAIETLFYFMRCSQLEHTDHARRPAVQELVYERPYSVLPPLLEWARVSGSHALHRRAHLIDRDDVMQAARLLLPGVDCAPRLFSFEELAYTNESSDEDCAKSFKADLAFRMLASGRMDLVSQALRLLSSSDKVCDGSVNLASAFGLTPLMLASIRGDEEMTHLLVQSGASLDTQTPPADAQHPSVSPETQNWTALTYASLLGHLDIVRFLLEKGAHVEGGAAPGQDTCTQTPLQMAVATGNLRMVSLLLSYSALPYHSTALIDSPCFSADSQMGCYSAVVVAAAHGQRSALHKLLSQPAPLDSREEVLTLEEILAESSGGPGRQDDDSCLTDLSLGSESNAGSDISRTPHLESLSKKQAKVLQEAMYHSVENGHLDISMDLRKLGVPWTLHCWLKTLQSASGAHIDAVVDHLLQDFVQDWTDELSGQFVDECIPLLFNIFRYCKTEATSLLLAGILSSCYGRQPLQPIYRDSCAAASPRIGAEFVNNPELSDVQFRLEGRIFYAHKIILVNASPRFQRMLNSGFCDGGTPVVQINDIRYDIFERVMRFLYKGGGSGDLPAAQCDVLQLMAAANFFQLEGLLRCCESRCAQLLDRSSLVSVYIHAKVYNAGRLLEFCQGFLLQHLATLLTADEAVKRLVFGHKLSNHDVLTGLQLALQTRIRFRTHDSSLGSS